MDLSTRESKEESLVPCVEFHQFGCGVNILIVPFSKVSY